MLHYLILFYASFRVWAVFVSEVIGLMVSFYFNNDDGLECLNSLMSPYFLQNISIVPIDKAREKKWCPFPENIPLSNY